LQSCADTRGVENVSIICQKLPSTRERLRVAVVTETYPPEINGVAMTIARLVQGLHARDHQVQLVRPRQHAVEQPTSRPNFEEILSRGMAIPRYDALRLGLPAKQTLTRLWSLMRPDLVHIVTEGPLGWSALEAASKLRLPVTSGFHTNFHSYSQHYGIGWLKKPILGYLRKFHNRTQATVVPTAQLRRELEAQGYRNLQVVARGVDTRLFSPARRSAALRAQWGVAADDPVCLYVGRLAPEKNLPVVLETFAAVRQRVPRARLVLVGDGPERGVLEKRYPEHIFAGTRRGDDLGAHYASADLFLFASLTETFGNVTLEAMASGLAVVAFDYGAAAEHIKQGRNGLVAGFGDAREFTELAVNLAGDASRVRELGARARATAENLDWERVSSDFERVLVDIRRAHDASLGDIVAVPA
jgi:glycosyltransferase involved in cell wall biosynthesis